MRTASSGMLNLKNWPYLAYISVFSILLVFSRLLFFAIFGVFSADLRFLLIDIHIRIYTNNSHLFTGGWLVGPNSAEFSHPASNL